MIASPAQETALLTDILALKDDPVGFAHYAYPWGRKGTPFEHGLRRWQAEELKALGDHTLEQAHRFEMGLPLQVWKAAYASGRGPGKSAMFGIVAHWHMSTRIGAPTIVAANTETQLRTKTFPEFGVWFGAGINAHWFTIETMRIVPAPWLLEQVRKLPEDGGLGIDPKYWYVSGQTWSEDNPDAFAGAHSPYGMLLLFDEASGIHFKVWDVAEGFFTEINPYRFWLAASQRRHRQGRFHEIFEEPKGVGADWRARTLSTRGMEGIDQSVIENQIKARGIDSDFVRVEVLGLPPRTSEDQFIPWDAVKAAQRNQIQPDYGEPLILGVDPAPRGRTAWRFRQGRNARDCVGSATFGAWDGLDNVQIAEKVKQFNIRFNPDAICIDFGMGTGVIDILKRDSAIRPKLHEVKFGDAPHDGRDSEWGSHAIELWARVRDWLPGGMVEQDDGSRGTFSQQATDRGWRWSGREEGKKILETKEDMHKRGVASPDDVDALACTMEVNPARRDDQRAGRKVRIADGADPGMFE